MNRAEFKKALQEKKFGDFVAMYRPFWNTGGEMGNWDDELMYEVPTGVNRSRNLQHLAPSSRRRVRSTRALVPASTGLTPNAWPRVVCKAFPHELKGLISHQELSTAMRLQLAPNRWPMLPSG